MAIYNTPLLGLPYAGADTDETYAVLAGLFVKDGQKLTLPEIIEMYTPTIGSVYINAADWTAADGTADAYDAKITISGVEPNSMILLYPATDSDTEKAKRLGIRAKTSSGVANNDTFVIVRATGGDPTVTDGISLVYIAFRGYAVWNADVTPPGLPYATVIGVDPYIATEEGNRDDIPASQRLVTEGLARCSADITAKLSNYYTKEQTLNKAEINALVSTVPKFTIEVVTALPTSNISNTTVYLVKSGDDDSNLYTEYIRVTKNGTDVWEKLGTQTVDLTGYATEAWVNAIIDSYIKTVGAATGQLVVEPSAWAEDDAKPYTELVSLGGNVIGAGDLILIAPENDATKEAAAAAGLTVQVNGTIDNTVADYVMLARAESGTAPTVALNLRYVVIHTANTELTPVVALVGVDGGIGDGSGASIVTEIAPSTEWLEANGDTSKCYLLPDGYIYEHTEGTEAITHNAVPDGFLNKKPKANGLVNESSLQNGNFCTGPIEVDPEWTSCVVNISGLDKIVKIEYQALYAFIYENDTETYIAYPSSSNIGSNLGLAEDKAPEVDLPLTFDLAKQSKWSDAKYIRISVGISKETITAEDVANLVINVAPLNTEATGGWQSTGKTIADFIPTANANKVNWVALGDSITARWTSYIGTDGVVHVKYDSTVKGWVDYVAEINGYTLTNKGVAGIGFAYGGPNNKTVPDVVDATDFSGADLVTIMAGINDFNSNAVDLGTVEAAIDRQNLTVVSGLRYCIERILAAKPDCKIVVITPINCKTCGNYASNYAIDYEGTDKVGGNLRAFAAALVEVCEYYGIEWVDMTHASVLNRQNIGSLLLDNLHPTAECHKAMGRELAKKINF